MAFQATLVERCLLYLLDRMGVGEDDQGAEKLVQDSIAEALGVSQAHASRAMNLLCDEGRARPAKIHARGSSKRTTAYFLTEKGVLAARELRQRFENSVVVIVDLDGNEKKRPLGEVMGMLPHRPKFSDIVSNVEDGRLDLQRFAAWQGRMYGGKVYDVRDAIVVPHFSGRREMLSKLDGFLKDPKGRGFLLVGLPGVGKTATASQWVSGLKGRVHVFWRCLRPETTAQEILHDLAELLRSHGRPALSEYLGRPSEDGRDLSLSVLKRDLSGLEIMLVVDNAHLARGDVASLLIGLVRLEPEVAGPKVLLLARQRVSFCAPEDVALGRVHVEELLNLPRSEASEMLAAMRVEANRRDAILDGCGGNPLCIELAATSAMPLEAIRRTSAERLSHEVLSALDPAVRDTLTFAAVFDRAVPLDALGGHVPELLRLCLLREEDGGRATVHDLVRDAAIHGLEPRRLAELHSRAGDLLARSRSPVDVLAAIRHFIAGGALPEAEELAATRGQDIVDSGMAQALLTLLDKLTWTSRESKHRTRIMLLRGHALFALGRWVDASKEYESCSASDDPHVAAEALLGQGKSEVQRHSSLALQHLTAAEKQLEGLGALRLLAEAQYWIGGLHEDSGHPDEARDAFEKGRMIAFSIGDRRWEGICRYGIGRVRSRQDDENGALDEKQEALRLLEREGCRLEIAKVCASLGGTLLTLGRRGDAEVFISRAIAESRETGAMGILASSLYNLASLRQKVGDMKEAIPMLNEALELYERLEKYDEAAWCAAWIASEEWNEGRLDRGNSYASRAERLLSQTVEPTLRVRALRNFARAALSAGRRDEADRHLRRAVAEAEAAGLVGLAGDSAREFGDIN